MCTTLGFQRFFSYCEGFYHTVTFVGHKLVGLSLNLPLHRPSPNNHVADCLHGRRHLPHSISHRFRPEMSHDFDSLHVVDLCMHRRHLYDRMIATRLPL